MRSDPVIEDVKLDPSSESISVAVTVNDYCQVAKQITVKINEENEVAENAMSNSSYTMLKSVPAQPCSDVEVNVKLNDNVIDIISVLQSTKTLDKCWYRN